MRQANPSLAFQFSIAIMLALAVVGLIGALNHTIPQGLFADLDPEIAASFAKIEAHARAK